MSYKEPSKARFEQAKKSDLINVLKLFEGEVRRALRDWAETVADRSGNVDRTAALVAKNACDLLDKLEGGE